MVTNATAANSGNYGVPVWTPYTPAYTGQTDSPVVTYTTQVGRYMVVGNTCFFKAVLVSSTLTKTTLTDNFQVTLPFTAATTTGIQDIMAAQVENGTAVVNGLRGKIASGASVITFQNYASTTANASTITWGTATPGIGVLTNTITTVVEGSYEIV